MHEMPILDLRIRKAVRRNGASWWSPPSARPRSTAAPTEAARYAPGDAAGFLAGARRRALGADGSSRRASTERPRSPSAPRRRRPGDRLGRADRPRRRRRARRRRAARARRRPRPRRHGRRRACSRSPTRPTAAACARSAACRDAGPGLCRDRPPGRDADEIRDGARRRRARGRDPLSTSTRSATSPTPTAGTRRSTHADFVVAFSMLRRHRAERADVVFPLETHAEKEGTVTHPDGRLQRVRPSVPRPGDIRPDWQVLARARRRARATRPASSPPESSTIADDVPFYARHHRRGDRRHGHPLAGPTRQPSRLHAPVPGRAGTRRIRRRSAAGPLGSTRRSAARRCRRPTPSGRPAPGHLPRPLGRPRHRAEPVAEVPDAHADARTLRADAERLGLGNGDEVRVGANGTTRRRATVAIRERMPTAPPS